MILRGIHCGYRRQEDQWMCQLAKNVVLNVMYISMATGYQMLNADRSSTLLLS